MVTNVGALSQIAQPDLPQPKRRLLTHVHVFTKLEIGPEYLQPSPLADGAQQPTKLEPLPVSSRVPLPLNPA